MKSCPLALRHKLHLFSSSSFSSSSLTESIEQTFSFLKPEFEEKFSEDAEQRINDWLDSQNVF